MTTDNNQYNQNKDANKPKSPTDEKPASNPKNTNIHNERDNKHDNKHPSHDDKGSFKHKPI